MFRSLMSLNHRCCVMIREMTEKFWDVIIIGTGMGGGTVGRALAERGLSVLFVEKGPTGYRREEGGLSKKITDAHARQLRGCWPLPIEGQVNGSTSRFFGPLGSGVGGSSVFYAAALERPEPHDLDHSPERPHPTGGWPISYRSFLPHLEAAEKMYEVCGECDPLADVTAECLRMPPPLEAADRELADSMRAAGLHPYRLHAAVRYVPECQECFGRKCPRDCKMDSRSAGVEPALKNECAALLERCEVLRLLGGPHHVDGVLVSCGSGTAELRGKVVVLAAGAYNSPRLLFASANEHWPAGCANSSGLVGRNLMFHLDERIAVWPSKRIHGDMNPSKAIALRDFYYAERQRFGMIQSVGLRASYGDIVSYLDTLLDRSPLRSAMFPRAIARLVAAGAGQVLGNAGIFVGFLEDLPYAGNRILPPQKDGIIRFEYTFSEELLARRKRFRQLIRQAFRSHRHMLLSFGPVLNTGHPCGTLRMGHDPALSVVDAQCRAHGIANLFVADASVFPTSMGVNPSLTIAANALRIAAPIAEAVRIAADEKA